MLKSLRNVVCGVVTSLAFLFVLVPEASSTTPGCPDHQRIVFESDRSGNYEIYSMNCVQGTVEVKRLTNNLATDFNPVLSHDGSKVAFVSDRGGSNNIFVMNADGSGVVGLTNGQFEVNPAWSPNDQEIAYTSNNCSSVGFCQLVIMIMKADGTGKHVVLHSECCDDAQPDWSPDGKKILFRHIAQIAVMNRDGTGFGVLTNLDGFNEWPHWSPSGKWIVFHSTESGHYQIYVMHAGGTEIRRITNDSANDVWPVWSPSGTAIAFQSIRDGNPEIYVMGLDGSITRLTHNSAVDDTPSWGREED